MKPTGEAEGRFRRGQEPPGARVPGARSFSTRGRRRRLSGRRLSGRPPQPGQRREAGFPSLSGPLGRVEPLAAEGRANFAEFPSPVGTRPHPRARGIHLRAG